MSSEILGEDVPLIYINNLFDTDKDGDLSSLKTRVEALCKKYPLYA